MRDWKTKAADGLVLYGSHAEALVLVVAARLAVRLCFRRIAPWTFTIRAPDDAKPSPELQMRCGRSVGGAVRFLGLKDSCLAAALAVKMMLARRGYRSTIHLGAGFHGSGELHGHAWIDAGGRVIMGEDELHTVTPLPRGRDAG